MMSAPRISVHVAPQPQLAESASTVAAITVMVNEAYEWGEGAMWQPGKWSRTTEPEVKELLAASKMLVACLTEQPDKIVGCIKHHINEETKVGEFGMVAVLPEFRQHGIGRAMINAVEETVRSKGCTHLQLQLLHPKDSKHPVKEMLKKFYGSLGFEYKHPVDLSGSVRWAERLQMPCHLDVYEKPLV